MYKHLYEEQSHLISGEKITGLNRNTPQYTTYSATYDKFNH